MKTVYRWGVALVLVLAVAIGLPAQANQTNVVYMLSQVGMSAFYGPSFITPRPSKNRDGGLFEDGVYKLTYQLTQSNGCAAVGEAHLVLHFDWVDELGMRSWETGVMVPESVSGKQYEGAVPFYALRRSAVTVRATYTPCTTGTWEYDLRVKVREIHKISVSNDTGKGTEIR